MIKTIRLLFLIGMLYSLVARGQNVVPLRLVGVTPLQDVHGRIDHFDVDLAGHRLFMSALGNNTLEVFDLRTAKRIYTIHGLREPQGVTYAPRANRIFVANGGDGTVRIFDGNSYRLLKEIHFPSDADDTRYDPGTRRVFVGYGGGRDAGLGILDDASGKLLGTIKLPGHPESFQLEEHGRRIFVNIPTAGNTIAVVDRKERKVVATWRLGGAQDNFPMALDEKDHRLFVACRNPPEALILDTESGKAIAHVPCVSQADDMWYDTMRKRLYISGGGGFVSVVARADLSHYPRIAQVGTALGGRTSIFVPRLNRLYLGVWRREGQPDELRVYEMQPLDLPAHGDSQKKPMRSSPSGGAQRQIAR